MKKILIIDTATIDSSISLLLGSKLFSIHLKEKSQTKEIIPIIKALLSEHHIELSHLSGIAICVGPGLYTGTRVGVMTAKTLSYALDIPLFPFSTFDIFKECDPLAILDAKCNRAHLYRNGEITLIEHSEIVSINEPIFSIDTNSFLKISNIHSTQKDLSRLNNKLETLKPLKHNEINVYYPTQTV
ncbi:MAG: hypothetical protein S4CHLAM20_07090 [Chlamydiia bacterium]|nr:hypothetical protein [Chlamydiia bacterium]